MAAPAALTLGDVVSLLINDGKGIVTAHLVAWHDEDHVVVRRHGYSYVDEIVHIDRVVA